MEDMELFLRMPIMILLGQKNVLNVMELEIIISIKNQVLSRFGLEGHF